MSWSISLEKPKLKEYAEAALRDACRGQMLSPEATDQVRTAQMAAGMVLTNVPGPYVMIQLSGHANGVGWQKKEGWANDSITVTVTQMTQDDLKYYENQPGASK